MSKPQLENGYLRIANEIIEQLAKIRIPGEAGQVLWVILRKTYGFNKKFDKISLTQFQKATNLKKPSIIRALKLLQRMNLISINKKANDNMPTYCFLKDFSQWKSLAKKLTHINKKANDNRITPEFIKDFQQSKTLAKTLTPSQIVSKNANGVSKNANDSLAKMLPTKDNITKNNITKDNKERKLIKERKRNLPNFVPEDIFNDFVKMRKTIKKPLTEKAIELLIKKLEKLHNDGEDIKEVLHQSIMYCWQGVYPVKKGKYSGLKAWARKQEGDYNGQKEGL